ncbi:hypothetical protein HK102_009931, partial [Quaeritorhiza haematococci]
MATTELGLSTLSSDSDLPSPNLGGGLGIDYAEYSEYTRYLDYSDLDLSLDAPAPPASGGDASQSQPPLQSQSTTMNASGSTGGKARRDSDNDSQLTITKEDAVTEGDASSGEVQGGEGPGQGGARRRIVSFVEDTRDATHRDSYTSSITSSADASGDRLGVGVGAGAGANRYSYISSSSSTEVVLPAQHSSKKQQQQQNRNEQNQQQQYLRSSTSSYQSNDSSNYNYTETYTNTNNAGYRMSIGSNSMPGAERMDQGAPTNVDDTRWSPRSSPLPPPMGSQPPSTPPQQQRGGGMSTPPLVQGRERERERDAEMKLQVVRKKVARRNGGVEEFVAGEEEYTQTLTSLQDFLATLLKRRKRISKRVSRSIRASTLLDPKSVQHALSHHNSSGGSDVSSSSASPPTSSSLLLGGSPASTSSFLSPGGGEDPNGLTADDLARFDAENEDLMLFYSVVSDMASAHALLLQSVREALQNSTTTNSTNSSNTTSTASTPRIGTAFMTFASSIQRAYITYAVIALATSSGGLSRGAIEAVEKGVDA